MRALRDWLDECLFELHRIREDEGPEAHAIVLAILAALAMLAGMLCGGALRLLTA
jgi:hypothetical protein